MSSATRFVGRSSVLSLVAAVAFLAAVQTASAGYQYNYTYDGKTIDVFTLDPWTGAPTGASVTQTSWTGTGSYAVPTGVTFVDVLLVAGGGAGGLGYYSGGGGGAGGLNYQYGVAVTPSAGIDVTVGAGGTANAASGSGSLFGTLLTASGGGGGGTESHINGYDGGSGGGGAANSDPGVGGTAGAGNPAEGNDGAAGNDWWNGYGGGGGGAGAAGGGVSWWNVASGGDGKTCSISGSNVLYAGGGGGAVFEGTNPYNGIGGSGVGGSGGSVGWWGGVRSATSGAANTGSGGGGGGETFGAGGSGIVIVASYQVPLWTGTGGTGYGTGGNWSPSGVPAGTDTPIFGSAYVVNATCDLGTSDRTLAGMFFAADNPMLIQSATNKLTLSNGAGVVVKSDSGPSATHEISAPLLLASDTSFNVRSGTMTVSGGVSGGSNVTKDGAGVLKLTGTNTYNGATTVNAGILQPSKTAALPGYDSSGKVVFNGGTVAIPVDGVNWTTGNVDTLLANATKTAGALGIDTTSGNLTQWTSFNGGAGNFGALGLTKLGDNTLVLDKVNTYTGPTTITAGTLEISGAGQLGSGTYSGAIEINTGATFKYNRSANQTLQTGVISGGGNLIKEGAGTLTLSGVNTYTGPMTITAGTLEIGGAGQLGSGWYAGAIEINTDATFKYNSSADQTFSTFDGGVLRGAGSFIKDGTGTLTVSEYWGGAGNLFTGQITINKGVLKMVGDYAFYNNECTYSIASGAVLDLDCSYGAYPAPGETGTTINGAGTLRFSSLYGWAEFYAYDGNEILKFELGSGGLIDVQASASPPVTVYSSSNFDWTNNLARLNVDGVFDLYKGPNVFADALTGSGTVTRTEDGTGNTLTVGVDNGSGTFSGTIEGSLAFTKTGTGTQTLTGANSYTGLTTVKAGTLRLGTDAQSVVLSGAGADIQGGKMLLDGAPSVLADLKTGYNASGPWTLGQFDSSTADASHGLGWDFVSGQTKVAYTFYGDATLDGTVDSSDLAKVLANYNQSTGMVWGKGDFNYDDAVDSGDLAKLLANYNQTLPSGIGIAATSSGGFNVVPEPSTLVLLAAGLLGLVCYAWRKRK